MRFDRHNLKVIPYPLYDIHFAQYLIVSMLGDPSLPTSLSICLFVYEQDISNSYGRIWTKLGGWVWKVTRTSRFEFGSSPDADPAYQWDTKCKLFSLAEVCALPSVRSSFYYWLLCSFWPPTALCKGYFCWSCSSIFDPTIHFTPPSVQ